MTVERARKVVGAAEESQLKLMAQIKGEHSLNVSEAVSDSDKKPPKPKRVASLDIFRGLTVAVLVFSLCVH